MLISLGQAGCIIANLSGWIIRRRWRAAFRILAHEEPLLRPVRTARTASRQAWYSFLLFSHSRKAPGLLHTREESPSSSCFARTLRNSAADAKSWSKSAVDAKSWSKSAADAKSSFLFLKEQIKDIIILEHISSRREELEHISSRREELEHISSRREELEQLSSRREELEHNPVELGEDMLCCCTDAFRCRRKCRSQLLIRVVGVEGDCLKRVLPPSALARLFF